MATDTAEKKTPWLTRLAWLFLIWTASVLSLALVAFLLRQLMTAAGMKS